MVGQSACSLRYRRGVTRWQGEGHVVSSLYNSGGVLERTPGVPNDHGDSRAGAIDKPGIDVTLPKAADQADHKAEQQLMIR